jgi:hypothetical protein
MRSADPPLSVAERIDAACDRFESEWKAGHRPRIEDYLAGSPGPDRALLLSALLAVEVELRRRAGLPTDADSFRVRFPADGETVELRGPRRAGPRGDGGSCIALARRGQAGPWP